MKVETSVISLGGWCRPAWQIRRIVGSEAAMPYDWQITSTRALLNTISRDYDPTAALKPEHCVLNKFGSVTDEVSGWIYQHDLHHASVDISDGKLAFTNRNIAALNSTREKYAFLIERFRTHCRNNKVTFVRWLRNGHPDGEWPEAFEGEDTVVLFERLQEICISVDLVYVTSNENQSEDAASCCSIGKTTWGRSALLTEATRMFRAESWTGDDEAWNLLLGELNSALPTG